MGDVIKDFYKSDAPQFKGRSKEKRREMAIAAKLTAERGPQNEAATEVAMSPAELALQKKKTMIDKMITMKRQQALGKTKTEEVVREGDGDPCWDTHKQVGMKKKGGKMVPNCVPKEEVEQVDELYKGKHGQTEKQYADSRSPGGKMVSGDSKGSGAEYTHGRRVKAANPGMQPDVGGKTKPKSQGKMDAGTRADLQYRKANLKKEEMSPQEIALQKRKANIDQMIAKKRKQELDKGKEPTKTMGEEASDAMKDRRMERGGVGGNVDYKRAPKFAPGPSKKKYDGMSALDAVKAEIRKKHGKGAIIDTKKK